MKHSLLFLSICIFLTSSCSILKKKDPDTSTQKTQYDPSVKNTVKPSVVEGSSLKSPAENYIERFKTIAIQEMNESGIPASITLAQGILESANGNSRLAKEANNHFGIKCTTEWKGKKILEDDDNKDDCFRVYNSPEDSFRDHSEFLKRKRYAPLFELEKNDYKGWAIGLKTAGYATNPRYAELLINLIDRYDLSRFDQKEGAKEKPRMATKTELAVVSAPEKKIEITKSSGPMKIYEVKAGDTIGSVSKQFSISASDLKLLNSLETLNLIPGQLLLVSK